MNRVPTPRSSSISRCATSRRVLGPDIVHRQRRPATLGNDLMVRIDPDTVTPLMSEAQSKACLSKPAAGDR